MHKNITVSSSGLSQLQKRILTYARERMLEKEAEEAKEARDEEGTVIYVMAPEWLQKATVKAVEDVFKGRKFHSLAGMQNAGHPISKFFFEIAYVTQQISKANNKEEKVNLAKLWELAVEEDRELWAVIERITTGLKYQTWPHLRGGRLCFKLELDSMDLGAAKQKLGKWIDAGTVELIDANYFEPNCTIPEMLRDIYGFPVREGGHIEAMAFDPEEIGRQKYNNANAALRRACDRLWQRQLIGMWNATDAIHFMAFSYQRTAIGLTKDGVAVADAIRGARAP